MKTIQDLIHMESAPGTYVQKIKPEDVLNTLIKNLGKQKGTEMYQSWTSSPTDLKEFMENLDTFNDRRFYGISKNPRKYHNFLEDVYKETWNKRNAEAMNYYSFIVNKERFTNKAILFSYDADLNIMYSIYREEIPIA
ncbi:MAG: hypothetical protein ACXABO_19780 [Promethearchaeota archaeon]|jgi:hypothetical protein